jgi:hypothetical protein
MKHRLAEVMKSLKDGLSLDMIWYFVFMVKYMGYSKQIFIAHGMGKYFN